MLTIEALSLSVTYGDLHALRDVSLEVETGTAVAVVGPNGAGKTTLTEALCGLRPKATGKLAVLGMDPRTNRKVVIQHIGVQLQQAAVPSRTRVREYIALFEGILNAKDKAEVLLERLDLANLGSRFLSDLSGGEQQKLGLVTALLGNPDILILDEMGTGLDPMARHEAWAVVRERVDDGATLILTSHFMDEVEALCSSVVMLVGGTVRKAGTIASLVEKIPVQTFGVNVVADRDVLDRLIADDGLGFTVDLSRGVIRFRGTPLDARTAIDSLSLIFPTLRVVPRLANIEDVYISVMQGQYE